MPHKAAVSHLPKLGSQIPVLFSTEVYQILVFYSRRKPVFSIKLTLFPKELISNESWSKLLDTEDPVFLKLGLSGFDNTQIYWQYGLPLTEEREQSLRILGIDSSITALPIELVLVPKSYKLPSQFLFLVLDQDWFSK